MSLKTAEGSGVVPDWPAPVEREEGLLGRDDLDLGLCRLVSISSWMGAELAAKGDKCQRESSSAEPSRRRLTPCYQPTRP